MEEIPVASEPERLLSEFSVKIMIETGKSYSQTFITPENELEQIRLVNRIERFIRDCITEFGLRQFDERF